MKYPPAPLTPFPTSLPEKFASPSARSLANPYDSSRGKRSAFILFRTLCRCEESELFCNQLNAHSFTKTPGVGGTVFLGDTSAFSASLYPEPRGVRYHLRSLRRSLFSRTYKLPPPPSRFASHAFSCTYKSLFPQLACFHKHLRCPLVFRYFSPLATRH
jgi:hypothetical protein